ncbi:MAG: tetratricopeptide repeat protein [Phormidesmis sp.]
MSEVIPEKTYPSIQKNARTRVRPDEWISRADANLLLHKRAQREVQQDNPTAAIEIFDRLIAYEPKNAINFANRGLMHQHLKQYWQALKDYNQAIALNPKLDRVYSNRANLHAAGQNWLEAIDDYDRAIELNPLNIRARLNQAITFRQLGRYEEALTGLDIALFFRPESATLHAEYGRTYQLQGGWRQAIASYNMARQLIQKSTAPDLCDHEQVGCKILCWMISL